jgi:NAD(P)-dependent dehydrogenase (short-subunit alcohol dehydrogenase family)
LLCAQKTLTQNQQARSIPPRLGAYLALGALRQKGGFPISRIFKNFFGSGDDGRPPPPSGDPFAPDTPLLSFTHSRADLWTIRDAFEGVQIFGALGSGKTSGSGAAIARAYLAAGFGGLVLTAKPDERELWEQYAYATGRTNDLLIFKPGNPYQFNFLHYEMNRPGAGAGDTENLVTMFTHVLEASERSTGRNEPFWDRTLKQLLRNAIDLVAAATGRVRLDEVRDVIKTAPQNPEQLENEAWLESSFCLTCIRDGSNKELPPYRQRDFEAARDYWLNEFPTLAEKTRSIIVTMFTSMADTLLRGKLYELFCTKLTIVPEMSEQGKIIILDLPVKEYGDSGRFAQVLFKYLWQKAIERRDTRRNPRPVFLWADEAQNFCTSYDMQFQATARSSRACTVYLTQNLPNYYAAIGSGDKAKHETDALLGNLQTKIFHANGDPVTNQWAAELIGKSWQQHTSTNTGRSESAWGDQPRQNTTSAGTNESYDYDVPPTAFTMLRKGGEPYGFIVDAYIFQSGRAWTATGKSVTHAAFRQKG